MTEMEQSMLQQQQQHDGGGGGGGCGVVRTAVGKPFSLKTAEEPSSAVMSAITTASSTLAEGSVDGPQADGDDNYDDNNDNNNDINVNINHNNNHTSITHNTPLNGSSNEGVKPAAAAAAAAGSNGPGHGQQQQLLQNGDSVAREPPPPAGIAPSNTEVVPAPPPEPDMNNLPANPMPKHQQKHALTSIKAVKRLKDAKPFLQPVDPVKLNVPHYFAHIKRPMDLSTIERKLAVNAYETPEQVAQDFNLMVDNCSTFNGASSVIAQMARNIQASFEKHMLNMPARDQPPQPRKRRKSSEDGAPVVIRRAETFTGRPKREIHPPRSKDIYPLENAKPRSKKHQAEMKFCQQVLKELTAKKHSSFNYPFLEPVDPVALNCPSYFDYVKEPMDLGTIGKKLSNWEYADYNSFERDVRLVFKNCYAFNPDGTLVNMMGHRLEDVFNSKWADRPIIPDDDDDDDDDDESEYESEDGVLYPEEDIDESLITNPAIQYLEQQLARMKVELQQLKRQELERIRKERRLARGSFTNGGAAAAGGSLSAGKRKRARGSKKKSGVGAAGASGTAGDMTSGLGSSGGLSSGSGKKKRKLKTVVTYDMKRIISERIGDLPEAKLERAVDIIKKSMPDIVGADGEVELDIDQLDDITILTLYNTFFRQYGTSSTGILEDDLRTASLSPPSAASSKANKRRRSKALSEEEQNKQIEKIKNKLAILDSASPVSPNMMSLLSGNNDGLSSSDDDDDDDDDMSSESEEE